VPSPALPMSSRVPMARKLTAVALVVAAIGFVSQLASGVTDTPTIPPGLVAIVAAALIVAFRSGRYAPVAGPAAGIFNLVAFVVVDAADRLIDASPPAAFVGAWFMVVALLVATVAGTIATVRHRLAPWT
jgi:hypothetical protein